MKNSKQSLWRNSPCSHAYATTYFSFQKSERFKRFSIYYRDDINKKKKIFNDIQKPELLLQKFKKELQQANSGRFQNRKMFFEKKSKKSKIQNCQQNQYNTNHKRDLSKVQQITDRLYKTHKLQQLDYDRFGIRSTLQKPINDTAMNNSFDKTKDFDQTKTTFFTTAKRFDLSRPLNFYPSPNKYSHHMPFIQAKKKFVKRLYKIPKIKTEGQQKLQK